MKLSEINLAEVETQNLIGEVIELDLPFEECVPGTGWIDNGEFFIEFSLNGVITEQGKVYG